MKQNPLAEQTSEFFKQWTIYRQVMDSNYMFHTEIIKLVDKIIVNHPVSVGHSGLSILDLGCGDAGLISQSQNHHKIERYVGVDLSEPALQLAEKHLANAPFSREWIIDDFLNALSLMTDRFDLIIVGFTLHHLESQQKAELFKLANRVLTKQGELIVYDSLMRDGEERAQYIDRFCEHMQKEWTQFSENEMNGIFRHVRENDQPEDGVFFNQISSDFEAMHTEFRDDNEFFALMRFTGSS